MLKLTFIFVLFVVFSNAEVNEDNESENSETRNDFVRNTFGRLLKSIVKINEQRFDAMKKLTKLQDFNVAMDILRSGNDDIKHRSLLAFVILDDGNLDKPEAKRQSTGRMDSSDSSETESNSDDKKPKKKQKENSRRVWKSCQKKAAKVCRKACIDAYETTCSEYACSKKMKKTFKRLQRK